MDLAFLYLLFFVHVDTKPNRNHQNKIDGSLCTGAVTCLGTYAWRRAFCLQLLRFVRHVCVSKIASLQPTQSQAEGCNCGLTHLSLAAHEPHLQVGCACIPRMFQVAKMRGLFWSAHHSISATVCPGWTGETKWSDTKTKRHRVRVPMPC